MADQITFCHLSDSHLGCFQYHLRARAEDFGQVFDDALGLIAAEHPDFVIHTGDLFDRSLPHPLAIAQFRKACKTHLVPLQIPFILLAGNHDLAKSARGATTAFHQKWKKSTTHHVLNDQGLGVFVDDAIYIQKDPQGSPLAMIMGVRYHGKQTCIRLHELLLQSQEVITQYGDSIPRIALLHLLVKGIPFHVFDLKPEDIDRGRVFDYVGIGHWHQRHENPLFRIYCPGATEHTSPLDWAHEPGFFVVSMKKSEKWLPHAQFVKIPHIRPKIKAKIYINAPDPREIIPAARAAMEPYNMSGAIIRYTLTGPGSQVVNLEKRDFYQANNQTCWFYFANQKLDSDKNRKADSIHSKPLARVPSSKKWSLQAKLDEFV